VFFMTGECNSRLQRSFHLNERAHALLGRLGMPDTPEDVDTEDSKLIAEILALVNEFLQADSPKTLLTS
jgi:hypothetical protein